MIVFDIVRVADHHDAALVAPLLGAVRGNHDATRLALDTDAAAGPGILRARCRRLELEIARALIDRAEIADGGFLRLLRSQTCRAQRDRAGERDAGPVELGHFGIDTAPVAVQMPTHVYFVILESVSIPWLPVYGVPLYENTKFVSDLILSLRWSYTTCGDVNVLLPVVVTTTLPHPSSTSV